MKKILALLIPAFLLGINAHSQNKGNDKDSIYYYQRQLNQLRRDTWDSLVNSERFVALQEKIDQLRKKSRKNGNGYFSLVLFGDILHSDYSKFNKSIAQDGFDPLNPVSGRFGLGLSIKNNRTIWDIYFFAVGLNNKTKKDDEEIKTSLSNVFEIDLGYDLLNSKYISFYPFAGLSLRTSSLNYSRPAEINSSYSNITDIVTREQSASGISARLGYQAGIGLDFSLKPGSGSQTIFFVKFGTNGPVWKDKYKIYDIKYNPGIKQGNWLITVGFKFANLNNAD